MAELVVQARSLSGEGIEIVERSVIGCVNLRGVAANEKFARAVQSVTDVRPPVTPCTSSAGMFVSVLWLGPDEWLITSETQNGTEIVIALRRALAGIHSAVTDLGDARVVYTLAGSSARSVLAKGCPVDLHPRAFAAGGCVQSLLAKAQALIHARSSERFDVYVGRSVGDYVWAWLENAAAEYR
jgi:sarcosine oxidase subunit gamma